MEKIFVILITVAIIGYGIYLVTQSPPNLNAFREQVTTFSNSAFSPYGSTSTRAGGVATGTVKGGGGSAGGAGTAPLHIRPGDIPEGYTMQDLSPNFKQVRIVSVYPLSFGSGTSSQSTVSLSANFTTDKFIDITGWFVRSNRGSQFIPQATRFYSPLAAIPESDILLRKGETVRIYSGVSSLGRSFRLNKCIGYLNSDYSFNPRLPESCPYVDRREIVRFTGICQDYILSLGACRKAPLNAPVPADDYECRTYLRNLNYQGCFTKYFKDRDFLSSEWWVWTGHKFLDERHDRVLLLDRQGLIVDEYIY